MSLIIIDNYDSFTFNLYHLVEKLYSESPEVKRNNEISLEEINKYDKIILSPGPGLPKDAGIMPQVIEAYKTTKPILGICLGMQAIGENFNCALENLTEVVHGQSRKIKVDTSSFLFEHCPAEFTVGRYHSWVISKNNFNKELKVIAEDEQNNIMAIEHKELKMCGVQFHPESILSEYGEQIIKNWLNQK